MFESVDKPNMVLHGRLNIMKIKIISNYLKVNGSCNKNNINCFYILFCKNLYAWLWISSKKEVCLSFLVFIKKMDFQSKKLDLVLIAQFISSNFEDTNPV